VDAVTLDQLVREHLSWLSGRHLSRPRLGPAGVVTFEVSGDREKRRLWLDAGRGTAGPFALTRENARALGAASGEDHPGRARQALLHLRKHADGARVLDMRRVAGERTVCLETTGGTLALRLSGPAPALTLARDGAVLGTVGDGPDAWPLPDEARDREWDRIEPSTFEEEVSRARAGGRSLARAVLAACPGLGPVLARETDGSAASFAALVARMSSPRPLLRAPGPYEAWHDADLAASPVALAPVDVEPGAGVLLARGSWLEVAALFLEGRRRGQSFERRQKRALADASRRVRRLEQLEANLARDLDGLADEDVLRREAEALLVFAREVPPGADEARLADPTDPERTLTFSLDPTLDAVKNAERRFTKARRTSRARQQITLRLRETRATLESERAREGALAEARDLPEVEGAGEEETDTRFPAERGAGPRVFLTSAGLRVLVGRHARENHELTFKVAQPEDLWFHARDVPGSHVILRDPEGRAGAADLREAAEVAAFYSEARDESAVDVHATRRKHVRPGRGGPGRVLVSHSETLRVTPRDPEGRLRRRG